MQRVDEAKREDPQKLWFGSLKRILSSVLMVKSLVSML